MENKKLKILFSGRKGILLQHAPLSLASLYKIIESYYHVDSSKLQITFKDSDKDECEVLDDITYFTACNEFLTKIVLNITLFNSIPISRLSCVKIMEGRKSLKFFKKKSRKMAVFDIESETLQWATFPVGIFFKEYAVWTDLPTNEVFYCGGGHPLSSGEAYILNPYTQTFKLLPNMLEPRNSHGLAYSNGHVYIFGGAKNMTFLDSKLRHCECYSLEEEKWEQIPDLDMSRSDAAAVATKEGIFVMGKGSQYLVRHNCNCGSMDLKEDEGGCMCCIENLIYVFQGCKVKVFSLESKRLVDEHILPTCESWWSHCPPIVHNEFIYFVWWEEPGWICRYNMITKEFKKLLSLFI